jgi:hypothetical protein
MWSSNCCSRRTARCNPATVADDMQGREDDIVVRHSISRFLPCLTLERERPLPFLYRGPRATATRAALHLGSQGCVPRPGGCRGQPSPRGRERCFVNEGPQCLVLSCSRLGTRQGRGDDMAGRHDARAALAGATPGPSSLGKRAAPKAPTTYHQLFPTHVVSGAGGCAFFASC